MGADSPSSLCPGCLLRLALDEPEEESLNGVTIGDYVIESRLGRGGMATVYLARDTSLQRHVALKFLSAAIDVDPLAQRRFLREARAAAALDHPYICHIHQVSEVDERAFIAMEYVRGQTLKDRLAGGPLAPKEAVRLAVEIAEALERAHAEGIIHRDLKPGNVMLTPEGHVKVMDFGLAKWLADEGETALEEEITADLTEVGTTLGTLAYMSPEQLRGRPLDARSDIFAFGTLLYQMLSGRHPFLRELTLETATAILRDEPPPLDEARKDLPEALVSAVHRMLEKAPADRFQSMGEIAAQLRQLLGDSGEELAVADGPPARASRTRWLGWAASGVLSVLLALVLVRPDWLPLPGLTTGPTVESLAVLPFEDLGGDPEQAYLADGMTDVLVRRLGELGALERVASPDSVRVYYARDATPAQIGSALDVDAVVAGTVEASGSDVRIRVHVVESRSGDLLYQNEYATRLADLATTQAEMIRALAAGLDVAISPEEQRGLVRSADVDPEALAAYLRGRQLMARREAAALERALGYFQEAIALDGSHAESFEGLADCYLLLAATGYSQRRPSEVLPRAVRHANRALELDPTMAGAHTILAESLMVEADWDSAADHFQRALRLAPSSPKVRQRYSLYLAARGRLEEGESEIRRALELDPVSPAVNATLGRIRYYRRDFAAARRHYEVALEMEPGYVPAHLGLGIIDLSEERLDEAVEHFRQSVLAGPLLDRLAAALSAGNLVDAARIGQQAGYVSPFYWAVFYALSADTESAVQWLERAHADRSDYVIFVAVDPMFDPIRGDREFRDFVAGLGL